MGKLTMEDMTPVRGRSGVFVVRDGGVGCGDTVRGARGDRASASMDGAHPIFRAEVLFFTTTTTWPRATGARVVDNGRVAWSAAAALWSENEWDWTVREEW